MTAHCTCFAQAYTAADLPEPHGPVMRNTFGKSGASLSRSIDASPSNQLSFESSAEAADARLPTAAPSEAFFSRRRSFHCSSQSSIDLQASAFPHISLALAGAYFSVHMVSPVLRMVPTSSVGDESSSSTRFSLDSAVTVLQEAGAGARRGTARSSSTGIGADRSHFLMPSGSCSGTAGLGCSRRIAVAKSLVGNSRSTQSSLGQVTVVAAGASLPEPLPSDPPDSRIHHLVCEEVLCRLEAPLPILAERRESQCIALPLLLFAVHEERHLVERKGSTASIFGGHARLL
eukprot:scaffold4700_cov271-Pinguiococcus_pyrenoidosus.AAC.5